MNGHGGTRHNKGVLCRGGKRHANGMPTAKHQGDGWLGHRGDHFGKGKSCFHIAAHGVQNDKHTIHIIIFFDRNEKRNDLLVFGRFLPLGQKIVSLNLPNDGNTLKALACVLGNAPATHFNVFQLNLVRFLAIFFKICIFLFFCHFEPPCVRFFAFLIIISNIFLFITAEL